MWLLRKAMATVNTFDSFDSTTFCLRSCEIIAMANDALTKSGLYLDELSKVKIVSPQTYQQSQELKEESVEFLSKVKSFDSVVDNFIQLVDSLSKKVEQEKIRAIGSRNSLKTVSRQKQLEIQQLETLIHEKQIELERLRLQHESLAREENDQNEFLRQFLSTG